MKELKLGPAWRQTSCVSQVEIVTNLWTTFDPSLCGRLTFSFMTTWVCCHGLWKCQVISWAVAPEPNGPSQSLEPRLPFTSLKFCVSMHKLYIIMGSILFPYLNIMYFDHMYSLYYFCPLLILLYPPLPISRLPFKDELQTQRGLTSCPCTLYKEPRSVKPQVTLLSVAQLRPELRFLQPPS